MQYHNMSADNLGQIEDALTILGGGSSSKTEGCLHLNFFVLQNSVILSENEMNLNRTNCLLVSDIYVFKQLLFLCFANGSVKLNLVLHQP